MNKDEIEGERAEVERRANQRILSEFAEWHPMEWAARVEMVCDDEVPSGWSWQMVDSFGAPPTIRLTSFDPRLSKR